MKKIFNCNKYVMMLLAFVIVSITTQHTLSAQGCDQVEILYKQPDCFRSKGSDGTAGLQNRPCVPITVCVNQPYTYTAAGTWSSYLWTITSGPATPTINPNATSPTATISWPLVGTYILTLTVTDGLGNTYTKCLEVTVREKPVANFTFAPDSACAGSITNFTNATTFSGVASYSWNFGDPASGGNNTSILTDPTHIYNTAGTYTVTLISYSTMLVPNNGSNGQHGDSLSLVTCCADTIKKTVTVIPGTVKIECISTVCAGDTATYTAVGCASPTWFAPTGGSILSQTGNQITIVWGNGNPQGQLSVLCVGGCTAYVTVPILPSSPIIVGNTSPCNNSITSYSLPYLPGTFYTWTLTNVTIPAPANSLLSTYPDNNTVWINWANAVPGNTYQLTIFLDNKHLCCTSTGSLPIIPKQKFSVIGPASICVGQSGNFGTNPSGIFVFDWSIAPTTGVLPTTSPGTAGYNPTFGSTGTFVVTALNTSSAFCNTTAAASVVVVPVPTNGTIQGPDTACANGQYNYSMTPAAPAGYYYEWTITNGTFQPGNITPTTSGNSVSVLWTSMPGTLSVVLRQSAAPFCVTLATTKTVVAATVGSISGTLNVCVDGSENYTLTGGNLPAGEVITWTITPSSHGTITAGQGTNNITVLWHGQGGSGPWGPVTISASTGCGPVTPLGGIMIYQKFSLSISTTGVDVCQPAGLILTANGAPGGSSYLWSPGGSIISTTNATFVGSYNVLAIMGGCSATKPIQILDPFLIAPVTCGVGECKGLLTNEQLGVMVIKPVSGTFTYQWYRGTYPTGLSVQGPTTTALLSDNYLATDSGNYYVVVNYGICTKYVTFYVKKVCCLDVNKPKIKTVTQVNCFTYTFTGTTLNPGGDSITWDFGDGTTASGADNVPISHTYVNAGIYCVKFCVGSPTPNPTNCAGNCSKPVNVIVPIQAMIQATLGCNGCVNVTNNSIIIISPPATVSYLWNFGDGDTSTLQSPPQHCYSSAGTYTITLTINYNNNAVPAITCTSVTSQVVIYTPLSIASNAPVCTGVPVLFSSNPSPFVTYSWNFGDGATAYISPISHSYINAANNIPVTLTVTDLLGNTCTDSITINVLQGINGCTILPGYICPGGSAMLSTTLVAGYTYLWEQETGPNTYVAAAGINNGSTYTTITPGNYRVIVTNANGCVCTSNTVAVTAVAAPKATFTISPSRNLCSPGGMVTLTAAQVSGHTYAWFANGNPVASGPMYMNFVSTTTAFTLIDTNQYGCTDSCTMIVTVNITPVQPNIVSNPGGTLCEGSPIVLGVNNYTGNITWSTGANTISITVTAAGTYVATYTDPTTGCSSSSSIVVNRKPSAGLFPHHCDSIPCHCSRPFVIYAPNPLIGLFASTYNIDWYNANTNTYLASGASYNNGGIGVQTGSYYVVITDQTTNCKDTSEDYSILVPPCDTCNCYESFWNEIILTTPVIKKVVKCNSSDTITCNTAYTVNASFNCSDTACPPKVTYSLLLPDNTVQTGNVAFTFTPTQIGTYVLTLYGWCGNKICDSCVIKLVTDCKKCDCKGSKWVEKLYTINNVTQIITCMKPADKAIDVKCKTPISINAMYNCLGTGCNSAATYTLVQPSGTTTGTVPLTFTPSTSGTYTVTLYGWCGTAICDTCVIKFKTFCPADTACCPYDIKLDTGRLKYDYVQIPNATVITETFTINGLSTANITEVRANVLSYTITDNFGKECMKCVNLPFTWASISSATTIGGAIPAITMYGGTTVPSFNGSGAGAYQNPREVIWNNGAFISIPNNTNVGINFILPPKPKINCCELKGKICVKFTFRDNNCKECVAIGCFQFVVK